MRGLAVFFVLLLGLVALSTAASGLQPVVDPTVRRLHKRFTWTLLRLGGKLINALDKHPYLHARAWLHGSVKFNTLEATTQRTEECALALFGPEPEVPLIVQGRMYPGGRNTEQVFIQTDPKSNAFRVNWNFIGPYETINQNASYKFIDEEAVELLFPALRDPSKGNTTKANLAVYQHLENDPMWEITSDTAVNMPPIPLLEIAKKWNTTVNAPGSDFNTNIPTSLAISFTCLCTQGSQCSCQGNPSGVGDFYGNLTIKGEDRVRMSLARDEAQGNATLSFTVNGEVPEDKVVRKQWDFVRDVCKQGGFQYQRLLENTRNGVGRMESFMGVYGMAVGTLLLGFASFLI